MGFAFSSSFQLQHPTKHSTKTAQFKQDQLLQQSAAYLVEYRLFQI